MWVTAFLNSPIDTEVFVKPPPGFDLKHGYIWKLNSALYGLKQSPMLWNNHIKHTLAKIGFSQNKKGVWIVLSEISDRFVFDSSIC